MRTTSLIFGLLWALSVADASARAQFPTGDSSRVLSLSFDQDGRVSLSARNVTIREILGEWARQCGCYVVNGEKLPGAPLAIPLLYEHETQAKVLESLLRQAAGYVLTPQRAGALSKSNFETIYILATSSPTAVTSFQPTSAAAAYPMPTMGAPDDELPPVLPPGAPRPMTPSSPSSGPAPPGADYPGAGMPGPGQSSTLPTSRPAGTPTTFIPGSVPAVPPPGTVQQPAPPIPLGAPGR